MESIKRFDKLLQEERHIISLNITRAIYSYLQLFISPVIARSIISALLMIAGVRSVNITQLTGLCERSIRNFEKQLVVGDIDSLFEVKSRRGRRFKFMDVEIQIVEEIEKGNYQTLRQLTDMIREKFGINASIMAVRACLKTSVL